MVKVDLVTGFLGSGKTTFILRYVKYLNEKGEKVCVLENDYGAVNVDMMLLSELKNDMCDIQMVSGGCDHECFIRRFKTKLITIAMMGFDRVIIEPSGIFDIDEFFDIFRDEPFERLYEIKNVLTVININMDKKLSPESEYILASQAACSGAIIFSHIHEVKDEQIFSALSCLNEALSGIKCGRRYRTEDKKNNIYLKDWRQLTKSDFEMISSSGFEMWSFEKKNFEEDGKFESLFFMHIDLKLNELKDKIVRLFNDDMAGKIIRVKGFLYDTEDINDNSFKDDKSGGSKDKENDVTEGDKSGGSWKEINATAGAMMVRDIKDGQDVLIVIGENLNKKRIAEYFPARYSTIRTV